MQRMDAAISKEENCFGVGICIRDEHVLKAKTYLFKGIPSPAEAESMALLQAIFNGYLTWLIKRLFSKGIVRWLL